MKTSDTLGKLAEALAKAQSEIKPAVFNAVNPFFKKEGKPTRYADLSSVLEAAKPIHKYGLSIVQMPTQGGLVTRLMHSSGEFIESEMPLLMDKQTMQGMGSALTYAKRFSIASMLCIVADDTDDDGNSASSKPEAPKVEKPKGEFDSFGASTLTGKSGW